MIIDKLPPLVLNPLLNWVETKVLTREPNQVIARHGTPYINRYMLGRKIHVPTYDYPDMPVGWAGGIPSELENVYVHEFIRSDKDDPHCHPWSNVTILLRGWYTEHCYNDDGTKLIKQRLVHPGEFVVRKATDVHAIVETSPDCLTLFITTQKEKEWGFWKEGNFIPWQNYHINSVMN